MSFIENAADYVKNMFNKNNTVCLSQCIDLIIENCYKEAALRKVISMLAGSLTNTEFRTYEKNIEVKKNIYYLFNVSPNLNSNKYDFCFELIDKLIRKEEALVVLVDDQFFIADSFQKQEYALKNYVFYDINIKNYTLSDTFYMNDVFYFRLSDKKITGLINSINNNYSKINALAQNSYVQNRLRKIIVNFDTTYSPKGMNENELQKLIDGLIKPFVEGDRNVLTLPKGLSLENIDSKFNSGNSTNIADIKESGKEIYENTISIFNIPLDLVYGNKAELKEQKNQYMTNGYRPFATMIETEINRKQYSRQQYREGSYIKLDLNSSEYINALEHADGLDKLFRDGFSHNYIRRKLGEQPLQEEWANKAYVTKNYMDIEGGETTNE